MADARDEDRSADMQADASGATLAPSTTDAAEDSAPAAAKPEPERRPSEEIREALSEGRHDDVRAMVAALAPSEARRALLALSEKEQRLLLHELAAEEAADLLDGIPAELASELLARMQPNEAAHVVEELDTDVQADFLGEMEEEDADAILGQMEPEEAQTVRRLAAYDDETAGGLMSAEAFSFRQDETVGDVLKGLVSEDDDFERYRGQHPYILDGKDKLVGVVSLRGLLTSNRRSRLEKIMAPALGVPPTTPLDTLVDLFEEHPFFGLPVTDEEGRLIGVVSRTAVADAELERAESNSLARQGVSEELRAMPTLLRSRRRLAWLSANIVLNIIAASVISAYEHILTAVIAIAVFLPMVSDMSGCSGNQAVAVTLRELALGLVKPADAFRVWIKEISVGVINGLVLGVLIGIVCWVWKGNPWLGVVIGLALALNTMIAVSIGGVVPLVLKRFRQDPAVASGPLLTTVTDMAGFFLVLSLASLFMPLLID